MSQPTEDQRLALANMHALARATLRARDAGAHRAYLDALADFSPEPIVLRPEDPRSDTALGAGVAPPAVARRFAARLRGVVLGAGAHADTVARELTALACAAVGNEGVTDKDIERRAVAAMTATRAELDKDIVRLGPVVETVEGGSSAGNWVRRWGAVRSLELNAFAAAFTRDGTHAAATKATRDGRDAGALRFVMAVAQAAMSLGSEFDPDDTLSDDVKRTENALPALLANVIAAGR